MSFCGIYEALSACFISAFENLLDHDTPKKKLAVRFLDELPLVWLPLFESCPKLSNTLGSFCSVVNVCSDIEASYIDGLLAK